MASYRMIMEIYITDDSDGTIAVYRHRMSKLPNVQEDKLLDYVIKIEPFDTFKSPRLMNDEEIEKYLKNRLDRVGIY